MGACSMRVYLRPLSTLPTQALIVWVVQVGGSQEPGTINVTKISSNRYCTHIACVYMHIRTKPISRSRQHRIQPSAWQVAQSNHTLYTSIKQWDTGAAHS